MHAIKSNIKVLKKEEKDKGKKCIYKVPFVDNFTALQYMYWAFYNTNL